MRTGNLASRRFQFAAVLTVSLFSLVKGNIYAGTSNGLLICLKTGDKDADEWYACGGNAQHNKQ